MKSAQYIRAYLLKYYYSTIATLANTVLLKGSSEIFKKPRRFF